jgi:hypothetical protein
MIYRYGVYVQFEDAKICKNNMYVLVLRVQQNINRINRIKAVVQKS